MSLSIRAALFRALWICVVLPLLFLGTHELTTASAAAPPQNTGNAQSSANPAPPPQTQGAVSTGGAYAPVLDQEKRPITAGGFVDNGPIVFQDMAEKSGLNESDVSTLPRLQMNKHGK
jgi:hypothetical protein